MSFERARTRNQILQRQQDIISSCREIYDEEGLEGVHFKGLSEKTAITRSSIYNYYATKEEVLLDLLAQEMDRWKEALQIMRAESESGGLNSRKGKTETLDVQMDDAVEAFVRSLKEHERMLRLYSILFTILEPNCRLEKLIDFKVTALEASAEIGMYFVSRFPVLGEEKATLLTNQIISYVLGLYPMTHINEVQAEALAHINTSYCVPDFDNLCKEGIISFLRSCIC